MVIEIRTMISSGVEKVKLTAKWQREFAGVMETVYIFIRVVLRECMFVRPSLSNCTLKISKSYLKKSHTL